MKNTGQIIKELRGMKRITQQELAEILNVKKNTIQKYEDGTVINLKIETIKRLCNYFEVPPCVFLFPNELEDAPLEEISRTYKRAKPIFQKHQLLLNYISLNEQGRNRALEYLRELNKVPEYQMDENTPTS